MRKRASDSTQMRMLPSSHMGLWRRTLSRANVPATFSKAESKAGCGHPRMPWRGGVAVDRPPRKPLGRPPQQTIERSGTKTKWTGWTRLIERVDARYVIMCQKVLCQPPHERPPLISGSTRRCQRA